MRLRDEVYKIEKLIKAMQEPKSGVSFRPQKVFLTTIPSAISGDNLISWIKHFLGTDGPQEATHIANILLLYGYVYPLTDSKSYVVKNDPAAFYRLQAPYYWLSKIQRPDSMEYAIYLVRRTLHNWQKYGLEDYEQRALRRLHVILARKWEFICMQAADQERIQKCRRKCDRIIYEAQPCTLPRPQIPSFCRQLVPQTLPHPLLRLSNRKSIESLLFFTATRSSYDWFLSGASCSDQYSGYRSPNASPWLNQPSIFVFSPCTPIIGLPTCDSLLAFTPLGSCLNTSPQDNLCNEPFGEPHVSPLTVNQLREGLRERTLFESVLNNAEDALFTNDITCDDVFADGMQKSSLFELFPANLSANCQVRLWATSFDNLLWDPSGCQAFKSFLEKEFSSENLRFWLSVNAYQFTPLSNLKAACQRIYEEFLGPNAPSEINIDCSTRANTTRAIEIVDLVSGVMIHLRKQDPSWHIFLEAKQQIYKLMKSDSYTRFLRSSDYLAVLRMALTDSGHHTDQHTRRQTLRRPPSLTAATSIFDGPEESRYTDRPTIVTPKLDRSS
ncbi:unnamed protein product [Hydatigera taeniaeformis]|uniref:RGS domain-containing protein n=1 Tax=Hydatigena taeniaeformis TaxID=6205 RepID=A0A0R3X6P7_HYDTA|nr:unnamed protein product [Hydatigera taeniaeformis]